MSGIRWADSSSDEESDEETFEIGTEEHEITTLQDFSEPAVTQVPEHRQKKKQANPTVTPIPDPPMMRVTTKAPAPALEKHKSK
mmetsp:Transcript_447/g.735  ORF Transcript_447/g.735 Transcript_447/m.735 type:complete len:84 (+) Transcript_447:158-409(+)